MNAFENIIGYEYEKKELEQIADILRSSESYRALGVTPPRGLLLYGTPGVGKTLMAKALIAASGRKTFVCRRDLPQAEFIKAIKATFEEAAASAPSIVFLDDLDKFANGDPRRRDAEEYVTVQSCMDEVSGADVFVLATANSIGVLPMSLLRPRRFDRHMEISEPHGEDAERIVSHYLEGKKLAPDMDMRTIARIMDGCSCAKLETVINEAGILAGYRRCDSISMEHFLSACIKVVFQAEMYDEDDEECEERYGGGDYPCSGRNVLLDQIVFHEAGHAVVSEVLCPGSVTLVSVQGSVNHPGGFTSYYNDRSLTPIQWLQSRVMTTLAGMAATEQKLGIPDSGASEDLDSAFEMIGKLVTEHCISGFGFKGAGWEVSAALQTRQEQEICSQAERYYRKAREILTRNAAFLDGVASALKDKGILTMRDMERIREECGVAAVAA